MWGNVEGPIEAGTHKFKVIQICSTGYISPETPEQGGHRER